MEKITLAEAFMLRNDIKKEISTLTEAAKKYLWEDKNLPIDFTNGTKTHPAKSLEEALKKMDELQLLNSNITVANLKNNSLLRENETVIAKIAFLSEVFVYIKEYPGDKIRNLYYSKDSPEFQFTENKLLIDPKEVERLLTNTKIRKREIEKELAHNNFTITI